MRMRASTGHNGWHRLMPVLTVLLAQFQVHSAQPQVPAEEVQAQSHAPLLPMRKPGLWEVTFVDSTGTGKAQARPVTVQQCTSEAIDARMLVASVVGRENCRLPMPSAPREGESHRVEVACFVHGARVSNAIGFAGDFQQAYQGSYERRRGHMFQQNEATSQSGRFEGRWVGDCQPGQQPGDMVLPNRITVTLVDVQPGDAGSEDR